MAMVHRGNKRYYYRSVRVNGRVRRVYCGQGEVADLAQESHKKEQGARQARLDARREREATHKLAIGYINAIIRINRIELSKEGLHISGGTLRWMSKKTIRRQPQEIRRAIRDFYRNIRAEADAKVQRFMNEISGTGFQPVSHPIRSMGVPPMYPENPHSTNASYRGEGAGCAAKTNQPNQPDQPNPSDSPSPENVFYKSEAHETQAQNSLFTTHRRKSGEAPRSSLDTIPMSPKPQVKVLDPIHRSQRDRAPVARGRAQRHPWAATPANQLAKLESGHEDRGSDRGPDSSFAIGRKPTSHQTKKPTFGTPTRITQTARFPFPTGATLRA